MPPDQKKFGLGKTTAQEMATLMQRIVTCHIGNGDAPPTDADRAICGVTLHMLRSQFYRDGVPRYLEPVDTSEEGSAIANKTGALDEVRNDVDAIATKNGLRDPLHLHLGQQGPELDRRQRGLSDNGEDREGDRKHVVAGRAGCEGLRAVRFKVVFQSGRPIH